MGWVAKLFGLERKEEPRYIVPQLPELPSMPYKQEAMSQGYDQGMSYKQEAMSQGYDQGNFEPNEVREVVFVRLDRFESSEKSFQDIKLKLQEIESNIRSVDRINIVEDERLFSWEKDLEKMKNYLIKIDERVFDQI